MVVQSALKRNNHRNCAIPRCNKKQAQIIWQAIHLKILLQIALASFIAAFTLFIRACDWKATLKRDRYSNEKYALCARPITGAVTQACKTRNDKLSSSREHVSSFPMSAEARKHLADRYVLCAPPADICEPRINGKRAGNNRADALPFEHGAHSVFATGHP